MATESLSVDPDRLAAAGAALQRVTLPNLAGSSPVSGSDPISAAINDTAPVIEAPILEGLPEVNAAVARSAANIVAAARAYADADQRLAGYVAQARFHADDAERPDRAQAVRAVGAPDPAPSPPPPTPAPPAPAGWQGADIAVSAALAAQGVSQGMQVVMQGVQTVAGGAAHAPTALASRQTDAPEATQTRLVGDTTATDRPEAGGVTAPGGGAPVESSDPRPAPPAASRDFEEGHR